MMLAHTSIGLNRESGIYRNHGERGGGGHGHGGSHDPSQSVYADIHLDELLQLAVDHGASDLHLASNEVPCLRIQGKLRPIIVHAGRPTLGTAGGFNLKDEHRIPAIVMHRLINDILSDEKEVVFSTKKQVDLAYSLPKSPFRFRVNCYTERGNPALVARTIPNKVVTCDDLKLPTQVRAATNFPKGLVLVTGPTGSGKSTTLAALIDQINSEEEGRNIITLEEPIEYLHRRKNSLISQREIPDDCRTFAEGLRGALREDPDVILIGEMRDLETAQAALTAAETGHLVFATLHTNSSAETIHRLVEQFPEEQQAQIRAQVSLALKMVIAQSLVPTVEGKRTAVFEVMSVTPGVANLIRKGNEEQLYSTIATSAKIGMMTKEQQLADLVRRGVITRERALATTLYPDELGKMMAMPNLPAKT